MSKVINTKTVEEYFEENKTKWFNETSLKIFESNKILSLRPDIGIYIKVNSIEISKMFFNEEFKQITDAYFSVIKKLDDYRENKNKG